MKYWVSLASMVLLCSMVTPGLHAQQSSEETQPSAERYTLIFQGTPMEQALKQLVDVTKIDLIYNSNLLGDQLIFNISKDETPGQILSGILEETNLDYILLSSGTYMLIESPTNTPTFGSFSGVVYDKATREPLHDANILLADASTGTSTNNSGRFSIAPLLSGKYEVTITYVGYRPVRDTVWVPTQGQNLYRFYLEQRPVFVEPLIISSIQPRLPYYGNQGGRSH